MVPVEPLDFSLAEDVTGVWVAAADHDGTPWIGAVGPAIPGLEVVASSVERRPADAKAAKTAATSVTAFGIDFYRGAHRSLPDLRARMWCSCD